jgi:hypothetical protein
MFSLWWLHAPLHLPHVYRYNQLAGIQDQLTAIDPEAVTEDDARD